MRRPHGKDPTPPKTTVGIYTVVWCQTLIFWLPSKRLQFTTTGSALPLNHTCHP
ncbi:hypothetical protein EMIT091MI3_100113 [Kosakonia quasisacchari]